MSEARELARCLRAQHAGELVDALRDVNFKAELRFDPSHHHPWVVEHFSPATLPGPAFGALQWWRGVMTDRAHGETPPDRDGWLTPAEADALRAEVRAAHRAGYDAAYSRTWPDADHEAAAWAEYAADGEGA